MKLEVGMYVRNKDGYVSQYRYYDTTNMGKLLCIPLSNRTFANIEDIIKASHNIIDLIEVGDYVNGYPVTAILSSNNKVYEIQVKRPNNRTGVWIKRIRNNEDIKSIVTKEQFENMAYKVGE